MITIKSYERPKTIAQAYELNQRKTNRIIGGMHWLKLSKGTLRTAIDLCDLGLDSIEETEEDFTIGAMVSLRQLETHAGLAVYTQGAIAKSLQGIVGVQFRNTATVGGSVFGRFGFSDVLTVLMACDAEVQLYKGGRIHLSTFAQMKKDHDILMNIIIKKQALRIAYESVRNTKTDFPVLACAVAFTENRRQVVIGGRPQRAMGIEADAEIMAMEETQALAEAFADYAAQKVIVGSNMRASGDYRRHLARVLTCRGCKKVMEQEVEACSLI